MIRDFIYLESFEGRWASAHFIGDNRKASACFSRARGFNRWVKSQQIGLELNFLRHLVNLGNLTRRLSNALLGIDGRAGDITAIVRRIKRRASQLNGFRHGTGILAHSGRYFLHGGGSLFNR